MFKGLSEQEKNILEYEIISDKCRLNIVRLFRCKTKHPNSNCEIVLQNRIINIARQVEGFSVYRLESDEEGNYYPSEIAWHNGELELITRRQTVVELIETLCDLIVNDIIFDYEVNDLFDGENLGITLKKQDNDVIVEILDVYELDDDKLPEHPNIRTLVKRMDDLLSISDYSGVLHASASIFETMGKIIVNKDTTRNQTFGSFQESYRKKTKLPDSIFDYVIETYKKRNTEPLAGHGSIYLPTITKEEAVCLVEMTKAFIKIERKLSNPELFKE